jgi:hypothetical protein
MYAERFGAPSGEFWDVLSGINADWDKQRTVETLSADLGVQCTLRWATSEGADPAAAQEVKGFLMDRMCEAYGLEAAQCEQALTIIEQDIKEERSNGDKA